MLHAYFHILRNLTTWRHKVFKTRLRFSISFHFSIGVIEKDTSFLWTMLLYVFCSKVNVQWTNNFFMKRTLWKSLNHLTKALHYVFLCLLYSLGHKVGSEIIIFFLHLFLNLILNVPKLFAEWIYRILQAIWGYMIRYSGKIWQTNRVSKDVE